MVRSYAECEFVLLGTSECRTLWVLPYTQMQCMLHTWPYISPYGRVYQSSSFMNISRECHCTFPQKNNIHVAGIFDITIPGMVMLISPQ